MIEIKINFLFFNLNYLIKIIKKNYIRTKLFATNCAGTDKVSKQLGWWVQLQLDSSLKPKLLSDFHDQLEKFCRLLTFEVVKNVTNFAIGAKYPYHARNKYTN